MLFFHAKPFPAPAEESWTNRLSAARGLLRLAAAGLTLLALSSCGSLPSSSPKTSAGAASTAKPVAEAPGKLAQAAALGTDPADWQARWDETVAAAKREGKVAIIAGAEVDKRVWAAFESKYGIPMDVQGVGGASFTQRVKAERDSGQFLWDVIVNNPRQIMDGYRGMGALDPLSTAFIRPEVTDTSKWSGGFDAGWADTAKSLIYTTVWQVEWTFRVNRDLVPESQLNKIDQLWEPAWKGKITMPDPRGGGAASGRLSTILAVKGENKLRSFLRDQQVVLSQEQRQMTEWVVRGQYPVGIGVADAVLAELGRQGISVENIKPLIDDDPGASQISVSTGSVALINRAPHPNAAKVFLNWFLGPDGQGMYSQITTYNSRRTDVPPGNPEFSPDPKKKYLLLQDEEHFPIQEKTIAIAREVLK